MITEEQIIKIASYFTIIAHSPGRIRVRVNPKIQKESDNVSIDDIESLPSRINGIKSIKINKIIASVTILYDSKIFTPSLWEDLIKGQNIEEISLLINNLSKEII
ncbi:MAG: HMA2 domain-containing protein [Halarcobacter sp.]